MRVFTEQITPTATITGYVHDDNPATIGEATRAGVLIFPGGGYRFCSPREAEPVAVAYLAEGFNAFGLRFNNPASTAPLGRPTD